MIYDPVTLPREVLASLVKLYTIYWNDSAGYDPGDELREQGYASLVPQDDYDRLEEACLAIEPHEEQLLDLLTEEPVDVEADVGE